MCVCVFSSIVVVIPFFACVAKKKETAAVALEIHIKFMAVYQMISSCEREREWANTRSGITDGLLGSLECQPAQKSSKTKTLQAVQRESVQHSRFDCQSVLLQSINLLPTKLFDFYPIL